MKISQELRGKSAELVEGGAEVYVPLAPPSS
jgi:hypothetical protein